MLLKEIKRFGHSHIQHLGDIFALVADFQSFVIVALTLALFAGNIDVREKMHLYFLDPVAAAGFTPSAFDIKGKTTGSVAADFGLFQIGEQIANMGKGSGVSRRIGAGRPANWRLSISITLSIYSRPVIWANLSGTRWVA
jgi:hypothetical protein